MLPVTVATGRGAGNSIVPRVSVNLGSGRFIVGISRSPRRREGEASVWGFLRRILLHGRPNFNLHAHKDYTGLSGVRLMNAT